MTPKAERYLEHAREAEALAHRSAGAAERKAYEDIAAVWRGLAELAAPSAPSDE